MLIGLTGSMAAGKSSVSAILREKGFCIVDADEIAHEILNDEGVVKRLCDCFGCDIVNADGSINRRKLGSRAFSSDENVERLNSITHPAIIEDILSQGRKAEKENKYVVLDVPLLIESGLYKSCDTVWLVCANIETRYRRIMERDGLNRESAKKRVAAQMPQWKKKRFADKIIPNDGGIDDLRRNVYEAIKSL